MFSFCPNCGEMPGQNQAPGQMVICKHCGHQIGQVPADVPAATVDPAEALRQQGKADRCPVCAQLVDLKTSGSGKALVPHFLAGGVRKMCPGSGKPVGGVAATTAAQPAAAGGPALIARTTATGKDLSGHIQREVIRVVVAQQEGTTTIQELTLEYLNKADRVRLQIEALREILGKDFRMQAYPAQLKRQGFGVWGNAQLCVIAKKHEQGGYQPMAEAEVKEIIAEVQGHRRLFFS